jgi:outer membrane protein assembly factor BamB
MVLKPGDSVPLHARLFDAAGRFLREEKATWSLEGLKGTVTDGKFAVAGTQDAAVLCLGADGKQRWRKHLVTDFAGRSGEWAYAESPLIDGDTLVCTPGGNQATIVALNKKSGDVLWKCVLPEADQAAYSSAIVVEAGGTRQYVQLLEKGLVGVEAKTGKFLWRYDKPVSVYGANIPTPVASDGAIW